MSELDILRSALETIAKDQPHCLAIIEKNGFVFNDIGREPGNWQHLAFTLYSHICQSDVIARGALRELAESEKFPAVP